MMKCCSLFEVLKNAHRSQFGNNDNDNDCQRRSTKISQRPALKGMSEGVITPRKKSLLRLLCLALLPRWVTETLLTTVCNLQKEDRINHKLLLRQIE